jgi:hypothetical protein
MVCTVAPVSYSPQAPGEFDNDWVSKSSSIRKAGKFFGSFGKGVIGLLVLDVPGEDIPCFTKLSITLFLGNFCQGYFFFGRKKDSFGPGEGDPMKGVKAGRKGTKKKFQFFFMTPLPNWSWMYLVKTFLVSPNCQSHYFCVIFARDIFFLAEKKIVLVRGKEARLKGSKRDEKGQKKNFNFFSSHVRSCDDLTAQPHVRCTCGPVRHH